MPALADESGGKEAPPRFSMCCDSPFDKTKPGRASEERRTWFEHQYNGKSQAHDVIVRFTYPDGSTGVAEYHRSDDKCFWRRRVVPGTGGMTVGTEADVRWAKSHFMVRFSNNVDVGWATATVTGKAPYSGTQSDRYQIHRGKYWISFYKKTSAGEGKQLYGITLKATKGRLAKKAPS